MTARIHKAFNLLAGLHFGGNYYVNSYEFDLTFNVETSSIDEQNIAMERIHYFLFEKIKNTVFVNQTDVDAINKYTNAGMVVCTLPEDPYDQIIGIMLMVKLNSILEGRLVITDITLASDMSDGVSCLHSFDESIGPFNDKGWWNDNSPKINDIAVKKAKVVKLAQVKNEWQEPCLNWPESKPNLDATEIIFTSFDKHFDKTDT